MSNRRRLIIILASVLIGSLVSFWFVKKRVGHLTQDNYLQLIFNFIFAGAIVIGLAILFQKMNKRDEE